MPCALETKAGTDLGSNSPPTQLHNESSIEEDLGNEYRGLDLYYKCAIELFFSKALFITITSWGSKSHPTPEHTLGVRYPGSSVVGCDLLPHKVILDDERGK